MKKDQYQFGLAWFGLLLLMVSQFTHAGDSFAERALRVIENNHPERQCNLSDNNTVVVCGDVTLNLDNLERQITTANVADDAVDQLIAIYYGVAMSEAYQGDIPPNEKSPKSTATQPVDNAITTATETSVSAAWLPQIVPDDYSEQIGEKNLVAFVPGLAIATSIDGDDRIEYMLERHTDEFNVSWDEARQIANSNMETKATATTIEVNTPKNPQYKGKWVSIDVKDGYAAARILSAKFRAQLAAALGDTFYVALPNRDFLIAWSRDFSYHLDFMMNVRKDFESRPHPLSPNVFLGSADGVREATPAELLPAQSMSFD